MSEFVKLNLSEKDWIFRALDLDQIELLEPQFLVIGTTAITSTVPPKEFLDAVTDIACESLRFKQPDITPAMVRKMLTLGTLQDVVNAIRGVSSLEQVPGEARAGT